MDTAKGPPPTTDAGGMVAGVKGNMTPLPADFVPGDYDVLCGRGKKNYNSMGNQRLRVIVDTFVEQYASSTSRQDKSDILSTIVNTVRGNSPHGGFVKEETALGAWFEVGDFLAREKVSQAFRDALSHSYRSSKKYKHEKRRIRDKAAKAAKESTDSKVVASRKPVAKRKSLPANLPHTPTSPMQRRGKLSILREDKESMSASVAFIPPRQGNAQPNRLPPMMAGQHASPSMFQGQPNQFQGDLPGTQIGYHPGQPQNMQMNNTMSMNMNMPPQDPMGVQSGLTSWSRNFPTFTSNFNPAHTGGMNQQAVAMSQQRRFSEAMMTGNNTTMNSMAPHAFHESDPGLNYYHNNMEYPSGPPDASFHSSFPSGMGLNAPPMEMMDMGGASGAGSMPSMAMQQQMQMQHQEQHMPRMQQQQHRQQRSRSLPLERSGSNVSAASASSTAIVARLESALPDISHQQEDENPFEPVPLPTGAKQEEAEDSILAEW